MIPASRPQSSSMTSSARREKALQVRRSCSLDSVGSVPRNPVGWEDVLQIVALLQALGSESAGKRQRGLVLS
jgi:hypothetical protein